MSIQSHYRKLLASPDDVSLALQLWTELLRTCVASEFATIDVSDSSIKTWKAINKLLYFSAPAVREPIVAALKPLLRLWPIGSRPLLDLSPAPIWATTDSIVDSGAWQLIDTLGYGSDIFIDELVERIPTPSLDAITSLTQSDLFWHLEEYPNLTQTIKRNLAHLAIQSFGAHTPQNQLTELLANDELRTGLKTLKLDCGHRLLGLFQYEWPDLATIRLDCSMSFSVPDDFPSVNQVTARMPHLQDIEIYYHHGFLFPESQRDEFESQWQLLSRLAAFCSELAELKLTVEQEFPDPSCSLVNERMTALAPLITGFQLNVCNGLDYPETINKVHHVTLKSDYPVTSNIEVQTQLRDFFLTFRTIQSLEIESASTADKFLCHNGITSLLKLRSIKAALNLDSEEQFGAIFRNLSDLKLNNLELNLTCSRLSMSDARAASIVRFPQTLTSLSLSIDADFESCKAILSQSFNLRHLKLIPEFTYDQFVEILSLPACRQLKTFSSEAEFTDSYQHRLQLNLEAFKKIEIKQLENLNANWYSEEQALELIDCFPSLKMTRFHTGVWD